MQFKNVSISYRERTILRDISLQILPGEFVFLIGASGSGKTTFIRALLGALSPRSGTILTDTGEDLTELTHSELLHHRRDIGVIFQDFKLLPRKTVHENVAFAMEVCGYDRKTTMKRIPEVLSEVGLIEKRQKFVETLSGGEVQRTCIARALIHHPSIIIGDEPTGNLDRKNATEIMHLLDTLNKEGKTIIMATHDEHIVNTMKRRVIAFQDGKIVSDTAGGKYCL